MSRGWLLICLASCSEPARPNLVNDIVYLPNPNSGADGTGVSQLGGGSGGKLVYLNFEGADLACAGYDDAALDESAIACSWGGGEFPPFDETGYDCESRASCIEIITGLVVDMWEDWNITFVTDRPTSGDYEMVMIGATASGAGGIALLDCSDSYGRNVSFAFSEVWAGFGECSQTLLATTVSQELAHALGVCHNDICGVAVPSVMCPYAGDSCDSEWSCGDQVDDCYCEGEGYDPYCPPDAFDAILGPSTPDTEPPTVTITSPQSGQTIPCNFTLTADAEDNRSIDRVEIYADDDTKPTVTADQSAPYEFPAQNYPEGNHTFRVVAYDRAQNTAEDSVSVTINCALECTASDCCCGPDCCEENCACADLLPDGDACSDNADCQGGLCAESDGQPGIGSICTRACAVDDDCSNGFDCLDGKGFCWASVGGACTSQADCPAGACVTGTDGSFCTVLCTNVAGACPGGYHCGTVETVDVCLPGNATDGSGCSVGGIGSRRMPSSRDADIGGLILAAGMFGFAVSLRASRRRSSRAANH